MKSRKKKVMSVAQKKASWKNFAKMRIKGAVTLRELLKHKYSPTLSSMAKSEIACACQHLEWALKEWTK